MFNCLKKCNQAVLAKIHFFYFSPSLCEYLPDVERRSQREHKARKQDRGAAPFELAVLPIVKIRHTQLRKKEHGKDEIDRREHDIADHLFDLAGSVVPGTFNRPGYIAGSKSGRRHEDADDENEAEHGNQSFLFHKLLTLSL